ncbi:hypothetical protein LPJ59_001546 [Coemansia sp. RSA 2399]|nr:hypothetical protein LPJ59_001546 [Coemansia sp. RSA 2399]
MEAMEQESNGDGEARRAHIVDLLEELLVMIFADIDPQTLKTCGHVCRHWRRIVSDERSWKRAFVRTFGRLPYERLAASSAHSSRGSGSVRRQGGVASWQSEYTTRVHLTRQWAGTGGMRSNDEKRLEFNARVGTVDRLIVSEKNGWALAVSKAARAAVKCDPSMGKVYARKNELKSVVFAMPRAGDDNAIGDDGARVSAVATRSDRIVWGFESGLCTTTHLTRYGGLRTRVVAAHYHTAPVLDAAGPLDHLAQKTFDWRNAYGVRSDAGDLVASSSASGSVHVWSDRTGQSLHLLQAAAGTPLVRVTWVEGARYVVAASTAGAVFVWDLSALSIQGSGQPPEPQIPSRGAVKALFRRTPWLVPEPNEYSDGRMAPTCVFPFPSAQRVHAQRVVQLAGDPFGDSFVLAVEGRGIWRMGVDGSVRASFSVELPIPRATAAPLAQQQTAPITVVTWKVDSGAARLLFPGGSSAPSRVSSAASQSAATSGVQTPKGKAAERNSSNNSNVLRLDMSKPASPTMAGAVESAFCKRLLLVGDATGSLWMFDGDDAGDAVQPLHTWARIHQRAVSAVDVNAAVLVSAARDGQVLVLDPLSGQTLRTIRCHGGGRHLRRDLRRQQQRRRPRNNNDDEEQQQQQQQQQAELDDAGANLLVWQQAPDNGQQAHRERRLDPRFWWVHLPLINERTRADVYLAQMLASRTSEQWALQTQARGADALDLARGVAAGDEVPEFHAWMQMEPDLVHAFPTLVADIAAGYAWVVVANGTRIHSCFLSPQHLPRPRGQPAHASPNALRQRNARSNNNIAEELAELRLETRHQREWRIEAHENRAYLEREFMQPTSELGLSADEQIAYALWLSQQEASASAADASSNGGDDLDSDRSSSSAAVGDKHDVSAFMGLAPEDMTEEQQIEYALFLSSKSS